MQVNKRTVEYIIILMIFITNSINVFKITRSAPAHSCFITPNKQTNNFLNIAQKLLTQDPRYSNCEYIFHIYLLHNHLIPVFRQITLREIAYIRHNTKMSHFKLRNILCTVLYYKVCQMSHVRTKISYLSKM